MIGGDVELSDRDHLINQDSQNHQPIAVCSNCRKAITCLAPSVDSVPSLQNHSVLSGVCWGGVAAIAATALHVPVLETSFASCVGVSILSCASAAFKERAENELLEENDDCFWLRDTQTCTIIYCTPPCILMFAAEKTLVCARHVLLCDKTCQKVLQNHTKPCGNPTPRAEVMS